jgi:hypothetical protein
MQPKNGTRCSAPCTKAGECTVVALGCGKALALDLLQPQPRRTEASTDGPMKSVKEKVLEKKQRGEKGGDWEMLMAKKEKRKEQKHTRQSGCVP